MPCSQKTPLTHPHLLVLHIKPLSPRGSPFKGRYLKRNGRSLLSERHSASLLPVPGVKLGVRFTWG